MSKTKLILYSTLVIGALYFVLDGAAFMLFGEAYKDYFRTLLDIGNKFIFSLKLFGISMFIGLLVAIVYDTVYTALPGGFLRKGLNFAFMLWAMMVVPFVLHFYIGTFFSNNFFIIIMLQYLIISLIVGFVVTGIYDEFHLRAEKKMEEDKKKILAEIKEKEEKKEKKKGKQEEPVNEDSGKGEDDEETDPAAD